MTRIALGIGEARARRPGLAVTLVALAGLAIVGCDKGGGGGDGPHGPAPATVIVPAGDATLGFAEGAAREHVKLASFSITRHPVTTAEYRSCVDAGACSAVSAKCGESDGLLDRATYDAPGAGNVPLTCATPEQANAYCSYVRGRLPRAGEWMMAARGPDVRKHPWGSEPSSCDRHPAVGGLLADARSCCDGRPDCTWGTLAAVGAHPAGASPSGVEDVLLARGELVQRDEQSPVTDCGEGAAACVAVGRNGAIEALVRYRAEAPVSTTFRCVIEEAVR